MSPWLDRVRRRAPAIVALAAGVGGAAAGDSFTATQRYEGAARLVQRPEIAAAVRAQLGLRGSVSSYRVDGSQLVAVVAKASSPARAAQLANGFAGALVVERT